MLFFDFTLFLSGWPCSIWNTSGKGVLPTLFLSNLDLYNRDLIILSCSTSLCCARKDNVNGCYCANLLGSQSLSAIFLFFVCLLAMFLPIVTMANDRLPMTGKTQRPFFKWYMRNIAVHGMQHILITSLIIEAKRFYQTLGDHVSIGTGGFSLIHCSNSSALWTPPWSTAL